MSKFFEFAVRVILDTFEALFASIGVGGLIWIFGIAEATPRFEALTCAYIALWLYAMYVVTYETLRSKAEEWLTLR